eukprot:4378232-Amphidinium_carterae.1
MNSSTDCSLSAFGVGVSPNSPSTASMEAMSWASPSVPAEIATGREAMQARRASRSSVCRCVSSVGADTVAGKDACVCTGVVLS